MFGCVKDLHYLCTQNSGSYKNREPDSFFRFSFKYLQINKEFYGTKGCLLTPLRGRGLW